ncbi:hypothetical protein DPEC_G00264260 [Dallia pectoralis]|uniref:Uncharacterized protein n=1 Tax=Dallia pectoralis TaxID=75939 RepID=A0ACC2FSH9_DALPE|nr:hypothetical protein DPEC_G00264260 [Dallia pectoralis]
MDAERNGTDYDYIDTLNQSAPSNVSPDIYNMFLIRTCIRVTFLVVYSATISMGLLLNSAVIFMTVKRRHNKKLRQRPFVLGLAVTHLVFCLFTPLYLISAWNNFSWTFEKAACKLGSYVMFVNMFSGSLMITFWNVRWCVPACFGRHMSTNMVLLSWSAGAILSTPSLLSRDVQYTVDGDVCMDNYDYSSNIQVSKEGRQRMWAVVLCRFLFGLLLPLAVTCFSRCCMNSSGSSKGNSPVVRPVTIAHFLCWAPVLCLSVLQVTVRNNQTWVTYALSSATALSVVNSCLYPVISIFQGQKELNVLARPEVPAQIIHDREEGEKESLA